MACVIIRLFYSVILIICVHCSEFVCAGSSLLHILPTDHLANNVSCPQNYCCTLNEWIESNSNLFTNETTVVLLPGVHVINTTQTGLFIEDTKSIVFTGINGKTIVWCINRFIFEFLHYEGIEISNMVFRSCESLSFLQGRNIDVVNVTIEQGGVNISNWQTDFELCMNSIIHLHNLNITSNSTGIYYSAQTCARDYRHGCSSLVTLYLQNCTLNMAEISMVAHCTQIDVQQLRIKRISNGRVSSAFVIRDAIRVSLNDISFENNTTPTTLLRLSGNMSKIELKGHILFRGNKNSFVIAYINKGIQHLKIFPHSKIEFYENSGIRISLLEFYYDQSLSSNDGNIYVEINANTSLSFKNNEVTGIGLSGGSIMVINTGILDSPRFFVHNSEFIFENNTILYHHRPREPKFEKAVLLFSRTKVVFANSSMIFVNNSVPTGGIFVMVNSALLVDGDFYGKFENNEGSDGGAMSFHKQSFIEKYNQPDAEVSAHFIFNNNLAHKRGGAIFVEDVDYTESFGHNYDPFFLTNDYSLKFKLQLDLFNNSAKVSGNEVYGGWIDCIPSAKFNITIDNYHAVTSNPLRICTCTNSTPDCVIETEFDIFPGQMFQIKAAAVGQRYGIVPNIVTAQLLDSDGNLEQGQDVQSVGGECTMLYYTVYSNQDFERIKLTVGDLLTKPLDHLLYYLPAQYSTLFHDLTIKIKLKDCLIGFIFDTNKRTCLCSAKISAHSGVFCDFENYYITKAKQLWLSGSASNKHTAKDHGLIIHDFCPYDYCIQLDDNETLSFHLESPDDQCAFNRSGVLCGACQENLSQVFGTSRCRKCSNLMIIALLPGILMAGVLLIGFLMLLNLTVSTGTINGLIFYANIIRVNQHIFFPLESRATLVLSTFIAWLNLDLGIETCFYDGLDAYAKTWLQFMFPLYIWLIVILIIVGTHNSTAVSHLIGKNSVSVLATLFLLSYTKILRVVIIVFSSTALEYPDGFAKRVWLYDGNLEFLKGKHAGLFVVSLLLLLLLSVPYTLSLVSIQWLQRISHFRCLCWVHRLMPLFDAYTGPYKHKHRYWTGLLLLIRVIYLMIFTLNTTNNPAINLLTISVITFVISLYFCYMQIYKNVFNTILEIISLLNIGLLSITSSYQLLNNKNSKLTTSISASIAFITFIFIVIYHISLKLASLKICEDLKLRIVTAVTKVRKNEGLQVDEQQTTDGFITHSCIELQEPLLEE